ncbi:hypothetical protein [Mesorhizobium shangrilense]|uniref:Uncharacterized protein n=1 Tax=Mesorhizobium shangrilense TaxID=460060 RepID=A0ABV2DNS7_9HYPH
MTYRLGISRHELRDVSASFRVYPQTIDVNSISLCSFILFPGVVGFGDAPGDDADRNGVSVIKSKLTKRTVDAAAPRDARYVLFEKARRSNGWSSTDRGDGNT